jgi:hypothetical protein
LQAAWKSQFALAPTPVPLPTRTLVSIYACGNAAEHSTAIFAALRNRIDLSLSIGLGSSVQIALFVAPVLVLASLIAGPAPMDISIRPGVTLCIVLSALIAAPVAGTISTGRSGLGMQAGLCLSRLMAERIRTVSPVKIERRFEPTRSTFCSSTLRSTFHRLADPLVFRITAFWSELFAI